jgi:hypothetical protein
MTNQVGMFNGHEFTGQMQRVAQEAPAGTESRSQK